MTVWANVCDRQNGAEQIRSFLKRDGGSAIEFEEGSQVTEISDKHSIEYRWEFLPVQRFTPIQKDITLQSYEQSNGIFICPSELVVIPHSISNSFAFRWKNGRLMEVRFFKLERTPYFYAQQFDSDRGPSEAVFVAATEHGTRSTPFGFPPNQFSGMPGIPSVSPDGNFAIIPGGGEVQEHFWIASGLLDGTAPKIHSHQIKLELEQCEIQWFAEDNLVDWEGYENGKATLNMITALNPWDFSDTCEQRGSDHSTPLRELPIDLTLPQ
ncbi:MAG: hypothetical protein CME85_07335 [Henriciella sp.]|nr:hypothetical protein [Henriciella sp.]